MTTLACPGELFAAPPSVSVTVPDGWEPVAAAGTLLGVRRPAEPGLFVSNLVVRWEHREEGFTADRALEELRREIASRREGQSAGVFRGEIDGVGFAGVDLSWIDDAAGTILQVHLVSAWPPAVPGGASYLLQMTGSTGATRSSEDYPVLKEIMLSARFTPSPARATARS